MAWRSGGSLSRSLMSAARAPSIRSSQPLPRLGPRSTAPRLQSRRLSLTPSRKEWRRWVNRMDCQSARGVGLMPHLYLKGHSYQHSSATIY